jgi:RNA 2',3'-cyclic 3'-phosphodiesterase
MRLFTAIDIPASVRVRLCALVDRLRPLAKLSWSQPEQLHVTTQFIGEWPEQRIGELNDGLAGVPRPGPIEIAVRGWGWFPNDRNPRVFWAGIEAGEKDAGDELRTLARDTGEALTAAGVKLEDREFHPHLTLARRRNPVPLDRLRKELAEIPSPDFGCFRAESFFLYLSRGGRYIKLHEFPLLPKLSPKL